jgi:hypothetical protein
MSDAIYFSSSPISSQPVTYSQVHALYLSLIIRASRRRALAAVMPALALAMQPVEDSTKLARLLAIAAELEAHND